MKMKTIFSMFLITWMLGVEYNAHAMMISGKKYKTFMQKAKTFCAERPQPCFQEKGEILDYNAERDAMLIEPIAFKNMHKLTSDITDKNRLKESTALMTALSRNGSASKVYLIDGKAAGFINYYISQPWYQRFIPYPLKSKANINCLAIDDEYQSKGIGTALLKHAIHDCEKQPVHSIFLSTTGCDYKLEKYYGKFGFYRVGGSKCTGVDKFRKRLTPYPEELLKKAVSDWIQKFRE